MNKNSLLSKINSQNGQALLIVVLVMVVALTVGLSIASKSITSFRNSTEQASSQKALSAAEAGVEKAINANITNNVDFSNISIEDSKFSADSGYKTTVTQVDGTEFLLNGGNSVLQSSGIDLWLTTYSSDSAKLYQPNYYPSSGSFTVYWGDFKEDDTSADCKNAALEVIVLAGIRNNPVISRYIFDPCSIRRQGNHFDAATATGAPASGQGQVGGRTFYYQATVPVGDGGAPGGGGLIARVLPLYMSSVMGVRGSNNFPSQGSIITAVGSSGNTKRKVNVFQGFPELPVEYYLYNLFLP